LSNTPFKSLAVKWHHYKESVVAQRGISMRSTRPTNGAIGPIIVSWQSG